MKMMMMMCVEGQGIKPDAETTLKELLNMPSDYEFSSLDLMTFGDLDEVDMAEYRRRSESEAVGVDFPNSADLKHVFGDVDAAKDGDVDGDGFKDAGDGDSIILLEERAAVANADCTLFKTDSGVDVEILHVGKSANGINDAEPMKAEDTFAQISNQVNGGHDEDPKNSAVDAIYTEVHPKYALALSSDSLPSVSTTLAHVGDSLPSISATPIDDAMRNFSANSLPFVSAMAALSGDSLSSVSTTPKADAMPALSAESPLSVSATPKADASSAHSDADYSPVSPLPNPEPVLREISPFSAATLSPLPLIQIPHSSLLLAPPPPPIRVTSNFRAPTYLSLLRPVPLHAALEVDDIERDAADQDGPILQQRFDNKISSSQNAAMAASHDADDAVVSATKRASVKIGGAEYRLVLPRGDRDEKKALEAFVAASPSLRASTPLSTFGTLLRPDVPMPDVAATATTDAASSAALRPELDSAEWNSAVDGCELKKIETLMNSKTLRKAKRKSHLKKYSGNFNSDASFFNKQQEIFQSFNAGKKIFIVVPETSFSGAKKNTKFVFKTSFATSTNNKFGNKASKKPKVPKHPLLRKGDNGPSTPKMFSKAAVQRNVLYMKSGDKLGYKKMRKMSSCPETGHHCSCPLKNKQSICHREIAAAAADEVK